MIPFDLFLDGSDFITLLDTPFASIIAIATFYDLASSTFSILRFCLSGWFLDTPLQLFRLVLRCCFLLGVRVTRLGWFDGRKGSYDDALYLVPRVVLVDII